MFSKIKNKKVLFYSAIFLCILLILLLIGLVLSMYAPEVNRSPISRETLVSVMSSLVEGCLGLIGAILGVIGAYYIFVLDREEQRHRDSKHLLNILTYTISKTEYININMNMKYIRGHFRNKYKNEWNDLSPGKTGDIVADCSKLKNQYNVLPLISGRYTKEDIETNLEKDLDDISDVYLFIRKLNQEFINLVEANYNSTNTLFDIDNMIELGNALDIDDSIKVREWAKVLIKIKSNPEQLDILEFVRCRKEIISIQEKLLIY